MKVQSTFGIPPFLAWVGSIAIYKLGCTNNQQQKQAMAPYHKNNGGFRHNNKFNNNNNRQQVEYMPDNGPAHCVLAFDEEDGTNLGFSRQIMYRDGDTWTTYNAEEQPGIRGFLLVRSAAEKDSVHEVLIAAPRLRIEYRTREEAENRAKPSRISLTQGPCLISVPSCTYVCPRCGERLDTVKAFIKANVNEKILSYEKDGKILERTVKVAKDDNRTEIKGIKDLNGHRCQCARFTCTATVTDVKPKRWTLDDRDLVSPYQRDMARDLLETEISDYRQGKGHSMLDAIPRIMLGDNVEWNAGFRSTINEMPCVVSEPFTSFSLASAQDLRNLCFGNRTEKEHKGEYWGAFGFIPRGIPKMLPRPGDVSFGEAFDLDSILG